MYILKKIREFNKHCGLRSVLKPGYLNFSHTTKLAFTLALALIVSCSPDTLPKKDEEVEHVVTATVDEAYFTERNVSDNVDSPAIWHGPGNRNWLLATAKEGNVILVYDAANGENIGRFAEGGSQKGQLRRPNGIRVVDDYAIVVERDNHRVQVFALPSFTSLGFFGEDQLIRPYGITTVREDGGYRLYITDNYETGSGQVPADSELEKRVHIFSLSIRGEDIFTSHIKAFGDTSGEGMLRKVESLYADTLYNNMLVADEIESQKNIKVYDLEGNFSGKVIGNDFFTYEPEGIDLYNCEDGSGYWFVTDQSVEDNRFYLLDRKTFKHIATFSASGTRNTDGIVLSQQSFGPFEQGAFFPVNDDGNISAISIKELRDKLGIEFLCGN